MRKITKTISVPVDGKPRDFRLTKLDAFSGASLLRLLASLPERNVEGVIPTMSRAVRENRDCGSAVRVRFQKAEGRMEESQSPALSFFSALSDADLRSLMTVCLEHTEVLLPAGWMPVMTRGEWSYPELEHDPAVCLKLTIEEAIWTLEGFFGGGGSKPPPGTPAT